MDPNIPKCPNVDWNNEDAVLLCEDEMSGQDEAYWKKQEANGYKRFTKKKLLQLFTAMADTGYPSIDESFKCVSCAVMSFFHSVSISCI